MHSPAPFSVTGQSDGGKYIKVADAKGRLVAKVPFSPKNAAFRDITDADDAKLFAAAPRLLAAARMVLAHDREPTSGLMGKMIADLRAAVREATE